MINFQDIETKIKKINLYKTILFLFFVFVTHLITQKITNITSITSMSRTKNAFDVLGEFDDKYFW